MVKPQHVQDAEGVLGNLEAFEQAWAALPIAERTVIRVKGFVLCHGSEWRTFLFCGAIWTILIAVYVIVAWANPISEGD
jgi:hypothetical protein